MTENSDDSFTSSKAEVFEALGHPTRIRLLQALAGGPLAYSELKRAAGLESNGLLTFHLGKMRDLVRLNADGNYALTDEGREALRIVEASKGQGQQGTVQRAPVHVPRLGAILAALVVVLLVLAAASAIEYNQIQGLDSRIPVTSTNTTMIVLSVAPNGTTVTTVTTIKTTVTTTATVTSTPATTSESSVQYVTGISFTNATDVYLTTCVVTGIGGLELRIVSDSTNASVSGEVVNAVDTLGCDIVGNPPETQIVHIDSFSVGQEGWLTPVFPNQAESGGQLSFTVVYQGSTYHFTATVPPIGTSCVTLHVPSANLTTTSVMNGQGSNCWQ